MGMCCVRRPADLDPTVFRQQARSILKRKYTPNHSSETNKTLVARCRVRTRPNVTPTCDHRITVDKRPKAAQCDIVAVSAVDEVRVRRRSFIELADEPQQTAALQDKSTPRSFDY